MSVRDDLTEIHGIGDAKADEIMAVVAEHEGAPDAVRDNLADAVSYLDADQPEYAEKFVRRAYDEVA